MKLHSCPPSPSSALRGLMCPVLAALFQGAVAISTVRAESIARSWNEEILDAIRIDRPNPPVHARNLFHLATVMYDCWAAYDTTAIGYIHHERATAPDSEAARREAISYAAYNLLKARYAGSLNPVPTLAAFDARMASLGYDITNINAVGATPSALGNRVANAIKAWGLLDGSSTPSPYAYQVSMNVLSSASVILGGIPAGTDPNRWQRLSLAVAFDQGGNPLPAGEQTYVGATWLHTEPFSLTRTDPGLPWFLPGEPSKLGQTGDAQYKAGALDLLRLSGQLNDTTPIELSPGTGGQGNNSLGADDGHGRALNPVTGQPYASNQVQRGNFGRVLAEFWADGPNSETPPGHWHVLANKVADDPLTIKKIGGIGPVVGDLEWDVKAYFALAGATHNAACAAWSIKRYYDGTRPITMIRYMGSKGQSSDPGGPSYHPQGLPLEPGVVEVITAGSSAPGQRHEGVGAIGEVAVYSWPGEPAVPSTQVSHVRWMRAIDWVPYQRKTFVTPAFPGYISGHSTFSRAAAEALTALTGSPFFPGGIGSFTAATNSYLVFEDGPSEDVRLEWATYYDAADQAGQSRRWGGIHVVEDDYVGRHIGAECGLTSWDLARKYWEGTILNEEVVPVLNAQPLGDSVVSWNSERGMYYRLLVSEDLSSGSWSEGMSATLATSTTMSWIDPDPVITRRFYRVIRQLAP